MIFGVSKVEHTFRSEELAGDVESLTAHDYDLLAIEELFGDCARQTTEEVTFAVHDDLFLPISFTPNHLTVLPLRILRSQVYHLHTTGSNDAILIECWCRGVEVNHRQWSVSISANDGLARIRCRVRQEIVGKTIGGQSSP